MHLDWIGYVLLLAALVPFLMGFAWSGDTNYGWANKTHTVVPITVGGVLFLVCLLYEWKGTKTGFLDHRLFAHGRNFPLCLVLIAVEGSLFYLVNNIYPSQVNGIWETPGTIKANAYLLPFFMVITVISPLLSIYVTKSKDVKWPIFTGFLAFIAAVIGLALAGTNGKLGLVFNGIGGIGFAPVLVLIMVWVQVRSFDRLGVSQTDDTRIRLLLFSSVLHRRSLSPRERLVVLSVLVLRMQSMDLLPTLRFPKLSVSDKTPTLGPKLMHII